ncbi:unnamed protein product [Rotaria socialis]|uniref:Reverse transcriptase domain-containing protein n=1 Tax=Rotaria socialis TaxID=392032 RepID=A0A818SQ72_9BILA|nr:unnamed protein product [Rotaria socialis]CAF4905154.1 unnamed protein product [Rotaria socialis]
MTVQDHIPFKFDIILPYDTVSIETGNAEEPTFHYVLWEKISAGDYNLYHSNIEYLLDEYINEAFMCQNPSCENEFHKTAIDEAYLLIRDGIHVASSHFKSRNSGNKFKNVPGWNDHCKDLHLEARKKFIEWRNNDRAQNGSLFEEMKESRSKFKNALSYCKNNELRLKKEKLIDSYKLRSKNNFWKEVKTLSKNNKQSVNCINNEYKKEEIIKVFERKYKETLDDKNSQTKPADYDVILEDVKIRNFPNSGQIFTSDLELAISKLNTGIGFDFIHSNHLKRSNYKLKCFLARLFSTFISHSYMPKDLLHGEIRPIIKNASGDKTDANNYRPVMNSSNFLKLFEYCLLPRLKTIQIDKHQFGFRENTGCINACTVLKETIFSYNEAQSNVYCASLDLTKAFDKVNPNILTMKLAEKNVAPYAIKIIKYMNENQFVNISFNEFKGPEWKIGNGVRQGGILSPLLFNIYMDSALSKISNMHVGCSIDAFKVNIIGYADDILLISPSLHGLQCLLDKFYNMMNDLCFVINA